MAPGGLDALESYLAAREWPAAEAAATRYLAEHPGSARVLAQRGWARYRLGHYAAALADFDTVLAGDPDDYDAVLGTGRCHRRQGHLEAAIVAFGRAHDLRPAAARPLCERGAVLLLRARYGEARADYDAAGRLDPSYPGLRSYVAELFLYTGRPGDALALSQQALADEPENLMHHLNVAHAHLLLGHTDRALDDYRRLAGQYHPGKERSGAELAREDLRLMAAAGVEVPDLATARAVLAGADSDSPAVRRRAPGAG